MTAITHVDISQDAKLLQEKNEMEEHDDVYKAFEEKAKKDLRNVRFFI